MPNHTSGDSSAAEFVADEPSRQAGEDGHRPEEQAGVAHGSLSWWEGVHDQEGGDAEPIRGLGAEAQIVGKPDKYVRQPGDESE